MKQLNVLVRGASGLLAQRLIALLNLIPQVTVFGIYRNDPTLNRIVQIWSVSSASLPQHLYLDGSFELAETVSKQKGYNFLSISLFDISNIDIVVDTTPMLDKFKPYQHFKNPIIMQDGVYPKGRLISLPEMESKKSALGDLRFRQGGCILSGVVPILSVLKDHIDTVKLKVFMQEDARENDYLISERLINIRQDTVAPIQISEELSSLFSNVRFKVSHVTKVPAMINYEVEFTIKTKSIISKEKFIQLFKSSPIKRVKVLNADIKDLYPLNLARSLPGSDKIAPIHILSTLFKQEKKKISFTASLYHRTLPSLANLDSIFHFTLGVFGEESMEMTDKLMGFK